MEFALQPADRLWSRAPGERRHDECGTRRRGYVRASPLRQRTKSASSSRVWRRFQKSAIAEIFMHSAFHTRCDFRPVYLITALAGTAPLISKIALRTQTITECRSRFKRTLGPMGLPLGSNLPAGAGRSADRGGKDRRVPGTITIDRTFDGVTNTHPSGILYILTVAGGKHLY